MSISAVSGVADKQSDKPQAIAPAHAVTPFSHQLDAANAQDAATHGHHHHQHGGASQSVASSAATAASAAGVASPGTLASAVRNLLS